MTNKKGSLLVGSSTVQLILEVIGTIALLFILVGLFIAFRSPPDQNIASLDIVVGEISTGIDLMKAYGVTSYDQTFPLSMDPEYAIYAVTEDEDILLKLHDPEGKEVKVARLDIEKITFESDPILSKGSGTLKTPRSTLNNYGLHIERARNKYTVSIKYCSDGWCLS